MIIESGVIIFLGLLLIGFKIPIKTSLALLGRPLALDVTVSVLAFLMHMGTFSGVMAAAVAGLMCSGFTSAARWAIGYCDPAFAKRAAKVKRDAKAILDADAAGHAEMERAYKRFHAVKPHHLAGYKRGRFFNFSKEWN